MGADESTLLITEKPLTLGGTSVPAGAYSLYMLPNEDGSAKLIINKRLGQWGTQYDESQISAARGYDQRCAGYPGGPMHDRHQQGDLRWRRDQIELGIHPILGRRTPSPK